MFLEYKEKSSVCFEILYEKWDH